MAMRDKLKRRLTETQIKEYMEWEKRWYGKRWYGEDGNKRLDELLAIINPGYKRKGEIIGLYDKVPIECDMGHVWEASPDALKAGVRCPICNRQRQTRDVYDVYHSIFDKYGIEMDVSTYTKMGKPAKFRCKNGNLFWGTPNNVERGMQKCQCEVCKKERGIRNPKTQQEYFRGLQERGFILDQKDWHGAHVKTKMWCIKGQHWTEQIPYDALSRNINCAVCSRRMKYSLDELQKDLFGPEGYKIREGVVYINRDKPIPLICPRGHYCNISVGVFIAGCRCRYCAIEDRSKKLSGKNHPMYGICGKDHPRYDHNKTEEERKEAERLRLDPRYKRAKELSKQRDGKVCVVCGMTESEAEAKGEFQAQQALNGHHLFSFTSIEKTRYILDNWITMCYWCHQDDFHAKYGRDGDTNGFQFLEWIESKNVSDELKETIRGRVERVSGFIESDFEDYDDYLNHIGESEKGTA